MPTLLGNSLFTYSTLCLFFCSFAVSISPVMVIHSPLCPYVSLSLSLSSLFLTFSLYLQLSFDSMNVVVAANLSSCMNNVDRSMMLTYEQQLVSLAIAAIFRSVLFPFFSTFPSIHHHRFLHLCMFPGSIQFLLHHENGLNSLNCSNCLIAGLFTHFVSVSQFQFR